MNIHSMSISIPAQPGTLLCNAACPFCISRLTGSAQKWHTGLINWTTRFERACAFCKSNGVNTLMITGKGEPFINLEDTATACSIGSDFFSIIEVQTNGSLCTEQTMARLMHRGLTTLAVSISHPDPEENARLIHLPKPVDLQKIAYHAYHLGLVVRLSYNLSKAWNGKGKTTLDWIKEILNNRDQLVHQFTFRIIDLPPLHMREEHQNIISWIQENRLPDEELEEIHNYIRKSGTFIRSLNWGASIYDVNGFSVAIVECLQKPTGRDDDIRSVIFMPDGHVYSSWELTGSILM
ncbi:MAG: radical SAM protein [Spirochaetales bacterium]|nr:radical SAM protein [Spirochaetales bacterium]